MTDVMQRARSGVGHLYPVDMVRVLTFACVIGVHTISTVNPLNSVPFGAAVMLLHFTREAFFVLTAFVLTNRYRDGSVQVAPFWRRRFLLVGVPYVVWSLVYSAIGFAAAPVPLGAEVMVVIRSLCTGTAWFHLYFLLVSLQFYLLFPLFQRLLRATAGRHGLLLAASAGLQVVTDLWLHNPAPTGLTSVVLPYAGSFVLSYQFFLVLGGVAAAHRTSMDTWIRTHPRLVFAAFLVTGALAEGRYLYAVTHGVGAQFATDVFQWVMVAWATAVVATLYSVGAAWADRRTDGAGSRFVERASDRSFGVFLVHPTILWALTAAGPNSPAALLPAPWSSFAVYAVAVVVSLAFVDVVRRTPLSLVLTGKRRLRPRPVTGPQPAAEVPITEPAPTR